MELNIVLQFYRHTVLLLLAVARFRLLHPLFGTRYLKLSSP